MASVFSFTFSLVWVPIFARAHLPLKPKFLNQKQIPKTKNRPNFEAQILNPNPQTPEIFFSQDPSLQLPPCFHYPRSPPPRTPRRMSGQRA
ncbi:hypothetical protein V6Z11_A05G071200 [Gossypium hirsutum]